MESQSALTLEIVTPEGVKLNEQVDEVTAPSVEGEFGVLPGHIPLLAALKTGILSFKKGGQIERVAVGSGFAEVSSDKVIVLTDRFIKKPDVDPVRARLELKEADEALDAWKGSYDSEEYGELVRKETWAAAQLELYGDPPPPTVRNVNEFQATARKPYTSKPSELPPPSDEQPS
jgi:F-type H+-transporting ATPase subunit epsilon